MTTADYLESLQDDLSKTVTSLDLQSGTDFTDIATLAENGGVLIKDQYFDTTPTGTNSSLGDYWGAEKLLLKIPDITIDNTVTSLSGAFQDWRYTIFPKIIFGNNVTNISTMCGNTTSNRNMPNVREIDVDGWNITNVTGIFNLFSNAYQLRELKNSDKLGECKASSFASMFYSCYNLTQIDLRNLYSTATDYNVRDMFYNCAFLQKLDMRSFDFTKTTQSNYMFSSGNYGSVPTTCLILVKDQTQKDWFTTNFSTYTNVQIASDYEASLNS